MTRRKRIREIGIKLGVMEPGPHNAITDVQGVGVEHSTIIRGEGALRVGEGPIRTGVTAVIPHTGDVFREKSVAAVDIYNAYGKSVGLPQIQHMGVLETPILLTDTLNTWRVADALIEYMYERYQVDAMSINPVVGETNGSFLNDSMGRHVGTVQVFEAIDRARSPEGRRVVREGNVGGGTPMAGFGFKAGIGTASRMTDQFTLGILVQLNCGHRQDLRIDGVPIGQELQIPRPQGVPMGNSIMMVLATDLNLTARQLWKVAKRAILGVARLGHYGSVRSGDFTIAFSTCTRSTERLTEQGHDSTSSGNDEALDPVYRAAVEATEEAGLNALCMAETMEGRDRNLREEIPLDAVEELFVKYGRL
jgi:D-aminopeptidase